MVWLAVEIRALPIETGKDIRSLSNIKDVINWSLIFLILGIVIHANE